MSGYHPETPPEVRARIIELYLRPMSCNQVRQVLIAEMGDSAPVRSTVSAVIARAGVARDRRRAAIIQRGKRTRQRVALLEAAMDAGLGVGAASRKAGVCRLTGTTWWRAIEAKRRLEAMREASSVRSSGSTASPLAWGVSA